MAINVKINGKPEKLENQISIGELLAKKQIKKEVVTIELNNQILDRGKFETTLLKEGDNLEFVYYMGGGN